MPKDIDAYIQEKLNQRIESNSLRELKVYENLVDFCSNDYLGFAQSNDFAAKIAHQLNNLGNIGNGSGGARTLTGNSNLIEETESQIAKFHKGESALIYTSGYSANLGFFSALPYRNDTVIFDNLIHASIRDGINLGKAQSISFQHNNPEDLEQKIQASNGKIYVVVEAIYSMNGDAAPLKEIAQICKKYDAALIVDEAHSNGIFGKNGQGLVCELGLEKEVFARIFTFGKALGSHGAAIVGSQNLKVFLINFSRAFIYTTAPAPYQVLSIKTAYDILSFNNNNKLLLSNLCYLFKQNLKDKLKFELIQSNSQIQCIVVPKNSIVKQLCSAIQNDGFDVRPIVSPTVPNGRERIRISIHTFNTEEEILGLTNSILTHTQNL